MPSLPGLWSKLASSKAISAFHMHHVPRIWPPDQLTEVLAEATVMSGGDMCTLEQRPH